MVAIAGGALLILSGLLSWSYDDRILDDISVRFFPIGIQIYAMGLGLVAVALGVLLMRRPAWLDPGKGLRILGIASIVFVLGTLIAIAKQAGGVVNANEGLYVALAGAVLATAGGFLSPEVHIDVRKWPRLNSNVEILIIVLAMALLLFTLAYTLTSRTARCSASSSWPSSASSVGCSAVVSVRTSASWAATTVAR